MAENEIRSIGRLCAIALAVAVGLAAAIRAEPLLFPPVYLLLRLGIAPPQVKQEPPNTDGVA